MSLLKLSISREEWLNEIESRSGAFNTYESYRKGLKKWDEYLASIRQTDAGVLAEMKNNNQDPDTYNFLNRYVSWLNMQGMSRASISIYFAALRSWAAANGVMLFNEYVKRYVKLPKQNKEMKVPLTRQIIKDLCIRAHTARMRGALLVLVSSGMRISEVLQLRVMDVNADTSPVQIKIRAKTTKTREERVAYMSDEAWDMVKILCEGLQKTDYIFVNDFNHRTLISFEVQFGKLRKECGFLDKYDNEKNYHVNIHAFRAYFMTQATKVLGGDTAHALLGHHQYLDQYFRLDEKERGQLYKNLEPYITVSNEYRQKITINEKDRQLLEMNQIKDEMRMMKAEMLRMQNKKSQ